MNDIILAVTDHDSRTKVVIITPDLARQIVSMGAKACAECITAEPYPGEAHQSELEKDHGNVYGTDMDRAASSYDYARERLIHHAVADEFISDSPFPLPSASDLAHRLQTICRLACFLTNQDSVKDLRARVAELENGYGPWVADHIHQEVIAGRNRALADLAAERERREKAEFALCGLPEVNAEACAMVDAARAECEKMVVLLRAVANQSRGMCMAFTGSERMTVVGEKRLAEIDAALAAYDAARNGTK